MLKNQEKAFLALAAFFSAIILGCDQKEGAKFYEFSFRARHGNQYLVFEAGRFSKKNLFIKASLGDLAKSGEEQEIIAVHPGDLNSLWNYLSKINFDSLSKDEPRLRLDSISYLLTINDGGHYQTVSFIKNRQRYPAQIDLRNKIFSELGPYIKNDKIRKSFAQY